ncbi:2537_t:CDS:2, partial [Funneliformis caledonium]
MTAVLRSKTYLDFKVPNKKYTYVYFKMVEAQFWQLKHYLGFRLKNDDIILPWSVVYDDWQVSLNRIAQNTIKKIPGCITVFCKELLNICNTFEGSEIRQRCEELYDDFYQRNLDKQIAERIRLLDTTVFSEHKFSEFLRASSKKRTGENNEASSSGKRVRHVDHADNFVPELFQNHEENEEVLSSDVECSNRKQDDDESILKIFGNEIEYSETMKGIYLEHKKHYPGNTIIDLRPRSKFFKQLSNKVVQDYNQEIEQKSGNLIPDNKLNGRIRLMTFNLQKNDDKPNSDDKLLVATIRIIRRTLPQFIKAFSLGAFNPLQDIKAIEKPHLNSYVHPCLEAALWHVARINYIFGEIPSQNHVKRECADGAGYMTGADKFQLIYVEGARPKAKENKELADAEKIARNLETMFASIGRETINNRRRIPNGMAVFGGQSEFCLHEIENANLPRDFTEMADFVWYYECILKWA